jgi:cytochrome c oxidase subunit 2
MTEPTPRRLHGDAAASKLYPALVTVGLLITLAMLFAIVGLDWWDPTAPLDTFDPKGPAAQTIMDLVTPVFIIAGLVFLFVEGGVIFLILKFRVKPGEEDDEDFPEQIHGVNWLEIGWTVVPAAILVFVGVLTLFTIFELQERDDDALQVTVTGQQWWWSYEYDVDDDGEGDFITANEMVVPAGRQVEMTITSTDVIHSFWIPALNGKRDAVPGRTTTWTVEADEPGRYRGQCTEFCGLSHARMQMYVIALPPDQYDEWVENQQRPAESDIEALSEEEAAGRELFEAQCTTCHLIDGVNNDTYEGAAQVSGTAPNLTHLMSRETFAGSIFDLYLGIDSESPVDNYLTKEGLEVNVVDLEAWLRNPPALKPMAPEPTRGNEYGRGMPDLGLSEEQIDQLVAYLETLE